MTLAWLTPDIELLSEPVLCRPINVPGSLFYFVGGALLLLTEIENWEQFGTATPDDMIDFFADMLETFHTGECEPMPEVGEIRAFITTTVPENWLILNGSSYTGGTYPLLEAVCPNSWIVGGDLVLPDLVLHSLVGTGFPNAHPQVQEGTLGGAEEVTLNEQHLAEHQHTTSIRVVDANPNRVSPKDNYFAKIQDQGYRDDVQGNDYMALGAIETSDVGSGVPFSNAPPYMGVNWAVYAG